MYVHLVSIANKEIMTNLFRRIQPFDFKEKYQCLRRLCCLYRVHPEVKEDTEKKIYNDRKMLLFFVYIYFKINNTKNKNTQHPIGIPLTHPKLHPI